MHVLVRRAVDRAAVVELDLVEARGTAGACPPSRYNRSTTVPRTQQSPTVLHSTASPIVNLKDFLSLS